MLTGKCYSQKNRIRLVQENVHTIVSLPTKRRLFKRYHSNKAFSTFYLQGGGGTRLQNICRNGVPPRSRTTSLQLRIDMKQKITSLSPTKYAAFPGELSLNCHDKCVCCHVCVCVCVGARWYTVLLCKVTSRADHQLRDVADTPTSRQQPQLLFRECYSRCRFQPYDYIIIRFVE